MRLTVLWLPFLLLALSACSSVTNLDVVGSRRAAYDDYVSDNLQIDRLYLKLRETAVARVLPVTPKFTELQAQVTPGFELRAPEGRTLFVVSLEMQEWARFSIQDFKFFLNGVSSLSVKEIMDAQLLSTVYPFAVPHDRAFIVEFPQSDVKELRIQTSQGQFVFNYGGS